MCWSSSLKARIPHLELIFDCNLSSRYALKQICQLAEYLALKAAANGNWNAYEFTHRTVCHCCIHLSFLFSVPSNQFLPLLLSFFQCLSLVFPFLLFTILFFISLFSLPSPSLLTPIFLFLCSSGLFLGCLVNFSRKSSSVPRKVERI